MTITVRNKRTWKKAGGEYIGRPSVLGNPFPISLGRTRCIRDYEFWIYEAIPANNKPIRAELARLAKIATLGDLNLICWCAPKACHGDIIKQIIEEMIS